MLTALLRRLTVLLALTVVALGAGCAPESPEPGGAPAAPAADRDPGVVVALDDFAAINIMALGVTPDIAYDAFGFATSESLYRAAGITAKAYGQALDVEEVAAAQPDVIVGVSLPTTVEQKDTLERLGTTAILDFTADWRTALRDTAKVLGREDRATRVEKLIDDRMGALKTDLAGAGHAGAAVSIMAGSTDGAFSPPVGTNLGSLIAELGLSRPVPQQAEVSESSPFVDISAENLGAHDGAALFLMGGRTYPTDQITTSPLYPRLQAVRSGRAWPVSGEMWFGSSPLSALWVIDDLQRTMIEGIDPVAEADAGDRLEALVTATA